MILKFIPVIGGIISFVVGIWRIVAGFIGVREALDLDTGNTIAVVVVGIIAYIVVLIVLGIILGAIGLSAAALTGAFS